MDRPPPSPRPDDPTRPLHAPPRRAPEERPTAPHSGETAPLGAGASRGGPPPDHPVAPLLPGLELLDRIGSGGFGVIYRAIDSNLDRLVAVKMMRTGRGTEAEDHARFASEAVITGNLQHPNIVPVHAYGRDPEGREYFTMRVLEGRTLAEILDALKRRDARTSDEFTLPRLLHVFVAVCDAVSFAHARGVIHRDLKPSNIMVGDYGEVYVLDWGLARLEGADEPPPVPGAADPKDPSARFRGRLSHFSALTMEGTVVGTPGYMSPEQAAGEGKSLSFSSDLYSLGVALYEMLTLHLPVAGKSVEEVLRATVEGRLRPAASVRGGRWVPPEVAAIARKALALRPAKRYPGVQALARDVRRFLEDREVSVHPDGPVKKLMKWARRNRAAAATLAAATATSVAAAIVILVVVGHEARARAGLAEAKGKAEAKAREETEVRLRAEEARGRAEARAREETEARLKAEQADRLRLQRRAEATRSYIVGQDLLKRGTANRAFMERAAVEFTRAVEQDDTFIDAYRGRAHAEEATGRYDEALKDLLRANDLARELTGQENPEILQRAGMIHYYQERYDRAKEVFDRAARADPKNAYARIAAGAILHLTGKTDEAIRSLRETCREFPDIWEAHQALASVYLGAVPRKLLDLSGGPAGIRDPAAALAAIEEAIRCNPAHPPLYVLRGMAKTMVLLKGGADPALLESCLTDYDLAAALDPTNYQVHLVRLQGHYRMHSLQVPKPSRDYLRIAEEEGEQLRRIRPRDPYVHCWRSLVFEARGKRREALEAIEEALRLAPGHPDYLRVRQALEGRPGPP